MLNDMNLSHISCNMLNPYCTMGDKNVQKTENKNKGDKMKTYNKPTIKINDEYSEGVYAASGCYQVSAVVHQVQQVGRTDYRIHIQGKHVADHTTDKQTLTISFNMPVIYKSSSGILISPSVGTTISISYNYRQNTTDNIGLSDLVVEADQGLQIVSVSISD